MKEKGKTKIPSFANVQEEAEFWDKHDTTDYEQEFKPVKVRFAKNLSQGITVRLDADTLLELRMLAREKGIGPTTLARMWILEHLRQAEDAHTRPRPTPKKPLARC